MSAEPKPRRRNSAATPIVLTRVNCKQKMQTLLQNISVYHQQRVDGEQKYAFT